MKSERLSVLYERVKFLQDCKNNSLAAIDRAVASYPADHVNRLDSLGHEVFRQLEADQAKAAASEIAKSIPVIDGIVNETLREISEIRGTNGNKRQ